MVSRTQDEEEASKPRCYVCGAGAKPGKELTDITRMLTAHKSCFCGHQAYNILNTGREEESPAANGKWKYEWRRDVRQYVKPEFADAVFATLAKTDDSVHRPPHISDVALEQIRAAAQEGFRAFCQAATLF